MRFRKFTYEKDDGDISDRTAFIVSEPRKNYLMLDATGFTTEERTELIEAFLDVEAYKTERLAEVQSLMKWRTFKPEGVTFNE